MARKDYLFTSESVSEGHPDKLCDRISDAVVDAHIAALPEARVACETMVTSRTAIVAGEINTTAQLDIEASLGPGVLLTFLEGDVYVPSARGAKRAVEGDTSDMSYISCHP